MTVFFSGTNGNRNNNKSPDFKLIINSFIVTVFIFLTISSEIYIIFEISTNLINADPPPAHMEDKKIPASFLFLKTVFYEDRQI